MKVVYVLIVRRIHDEIELRKYSVEIAMKSNSICDPAELARKIYYFITDGFTQEPHSQFATTDTD